MEPITAVVSEWLNHLGIEPKVASITFEQKIVIFETIIGTCFKMKEWRILIKSEAN